MVYLYGYQTHSRSGDIQDVPCSRVLGRIGYAKRGFFEYFLSPYMHLPLLCFDRFQIFLDLSFTLSYY
jgi:hypothetical protein